MEISQCVSFLPNFWVKNINFISSLNPTVTVENFTNQNFDKQWGKLQTPWCCVGENRGKFHKREVELAPSAYHDEAFTLTRIKPPI